MANLPRSDDEPVPQPPNGRRRFLRRGLQLLILPAALGLRALLRRAHELPENRERIVTVPDAGGEGAQCHEHCIVVRSAAGTAVFSNICTHLGCRLNRAEGSEIVCACHGSRFDLRGAVVQGPATRDLQALKFERDADAGVLRVWLDPS